MSSGVLCVDSTICLGPTQCLTMPQCLNPMPQCLTRPNASRQKSQKRPACLARGFKKLFPRLEIQSLPASILSFTQWAIDLHLKKLIPPQTCEKRFLGEPNLRAGFGPGHHITQCSMPSWSDPMPTIALKPDMRFISETGKSAPPWLRSLRLRCPVIRPSSGLQKQAATETCLF
jgi:hypothetical protein